MPKDAHLCVARECGVVFVISLPSESTFMVRSRRRFRFSSPGYTYGVDGTFDLSLIAAATTEGVRVFSGDSGDCIQFVPIFRGAVDVRLECSGARFWCAPRSFLTFRCHSVSSGKCKCVIKKRFPLSPHLIALNSPWETEIVFANQVGFAEVFDAVSGEPLHALDKPDITWCSVCYDTTGRLLLGDHRGFIHTLEGRVDYFRLTGGWLTFLRAETSFILASTQSRVVMLSPDLRPLRAFYSRSWALGASLCASTNEVMVATEKSHWKRIRWSVIF